MSEFERLEEKVAKMLTLIAELKERVGVLESENRKLFEMKGEVARRIDSVIKKLDALPEDEKGA